MTVVTLHAIVDRTAAILAGHSTYGASTVEVDVAALNSAQREILASLPQPGGRNDREGFALRDDDHIPDLPRLAPEDVPAILDRVAARRAEAKEQREQATIAAIAWVRGIAPERLATEFCRNIEYSYLRLVPDEERHPAVYCHADWHAVAADQEAAAIIAAAAAIQAARKEAEDAERKAAWEAEQRQRREIEAARLAVLAAVVREYGDMNAIGRLNAGLLPEREQMAIAEDAAFEPLAAYQRWTDKGSISAPDYGRPVSEATAMQFAGLQIIRAAAQAARMDAACALHTGADRSFATTIVLVTVTFRGMTLSRAFGLPVQQASQEAAS